MSKHLRGAERQARGFRVGLVGLIGNILLFGVKLGAGILSGSIAVVVDAMNSLLDSASSVITLFGFKFSSKKEDYDHPHGHGRAEYIAALVISIIIVVTALVLGYASVQKIISPTKVDSSMIFVLVVALSIVGKGLIAVYYLFENRKIKSQMLSASGRDAFGDMLATAVTLVALIFAPATDFPIDGVAGLLVSLFILFLGGKSFFANYHLLLGHRPDRKTIYAVRKTVLSKESFRKIESLDFHDYGPENRDILVKVRLSYGATKYKIERDIAAVQKELNERYSAEVVIYWPPKA